MQPRSWDYQFAALLGYKLSPKWTLLAGYRYLFVDYRPSNLSIFNVVTSGALLGVTNNFK
jgi:outer membrane receptor protein involved in Fe transport